MCMMVGLQIDLFLFGSIFLFGSFLYSFGNKMSVLTKTWSVNLTILNFICLYFTSFLLFYGYSQTRKEYWTGRSKMTDLASKLLPLYKRNDLSIYV